MFLFVPYNTDAPIYHRPVGTTGLVIANVVMFLLQTALPSEVTSPLILSFHTINPVQWLTAAFLHLDFTHLAGNMFFLWSFGLVVEGKLGWKKFLPLYLGTAIFEGAITQLIVFFLMETESPGALGASGVIYSLIAMSLIWAPNNNINFAVYYFWRMGSSNGGSFPVSIHIVFFFYIAFDVAEMSMAGISSGFLHFLGAVAGLIVGFPMLLWGYVDCEGGDILSAVTGKKFKKPVTAAELAEQQRLAEEQKREREEKIRNAQNFVENLLTNGRPEDAFNRYHKLLCNHPELQPDSHLLLRIAKGLLASKQYDAVVMLTKQYQETFPADERNLLLIYCGTALVQTKRAKSALRILNDFQPNHANEPSRKAVKRLILAAKKIIAEGDLEIEGI